MILSCSSLFAQKVKTVSAEYTFYVPETMTIEEAKRTALDRAKIKAIEDEFGTIVSQINVTSIENNNGNSNATFQTVGGSEVRGEWIETKKEPAYDISSLGNQVVVNVKVIGVIRELVKQKADFTAKILRNGIELKNESDEFYSGDDMYLYFHSSSVGYLIVYLVDDKSAFRLLPYRKLEVSSMPVENFDPIVFFHKGSVPLSERRLVDEYTLTANNSTEINTLFIIFSPNNISRTTDFQIEKGLPRELSSKDFTKWLNSIRRQDNQIVVKELPIIIKQRQ